MMDTITLTHIIAVFFLFIAIFSEEYRWCSVIIFLASLINVLMIDDSITDILSEAYSLAHIEDTKRAIGIDAASALLLAFAFKKPAFKQSALLAFATLCHTMLLYDLTITSTQVTNFFYNWYEELIVVIGLLQMAVAHDGITSALNRVRESLYRLRVGGHGYTKALSKQQKRKAKT